MSLSVALNGPLFALGGPREAASELRCSCVVSSPVGLSRYPSSSAKLSASRPPTNRARRLGPNLESWVGTPLRLSPPAPLQARGRGATVIVRATTDLYQTLGVPYTANKQEIKKAFREMARKYHPDVSQASGSGRAFQAIVAAYEVLSDDQQRRLYDLSTARTLSGSRRRSPRHWSSMSSATSAHRSSARSASESPRFSRHNQSGPRVSSIQSHSPSHLQFSSPSVLLPYLHTSFDPSDRTFSGSAWPSSEPISASARASSSECPIFSAWYLRWLFNVRWSLAVKRRTRRAAEFKSRGATELKREGAADVRSRRDAGGKARGGWEGVSQEGGVCSQAGGEGRRLHTQRGSERLEQAGSEQAGSEALLETGGLWGGDGLTSGRVVVVAAAEFAGPPAAAASTGAAATAATAAEGGAGRREEVTRSREKNTISGSRVSGEEADLQDTAASAAAAAAAPRSKAQTEPLTSHALSLLSFFRHAPSSLFHLLLSPLQPEWRASIGSDLVFILVSSVLWAIYGIDATVAWLSLVLILSANTRLGLKVAGAVAWRLGGMPGLGMGVGLHALLFLLGNVHHEAVGAMALSVCMGRGVVGGFALAPVIVVFFVYKCLGLVDFIWLECRRAWICGARRAFEGEVGQWEGDYMEGSDEFAYATREPVAYHMSMAPL